MSCPVAGAGLALRPGVLLAHLPAVAALPAGLTSGPLVRARQGGLADAGRAFYEQRADRWPSRPPDAEPRLT